MICSICGKREAISREGWCRRCLRDKLDEKFGFVSRAGGHPGSLRTQDQREERGGDPSPWGENAVRALEDGR